MPPQHDSNFTKSLEAAREAFSQRDLEGATRHVASALAEDPNHADALSLLDEIIAGAEDPLELVAEGELPLTSPLAAVRCYTLAGQGEVTEAIHKLLQVISDRPD